MKQNINDIKFTGFIDSEIEHDATGIEFTLTQHPSVIIYDELVQDANSEAFSVNVRINCSDISYYRLLKTSDRILVEGRLFFDDSKNEIIILASFAQSCYPVENFLFKKKLKNKNFKIITSFSKQLNLPAY